MVIMSRKLYAVILLAAINQNVEGNEPVRSAAFSPRSRVAPAVAVDLDADAPVWNGRAEQANRVQQTGVWIPEQSNRPLPPNAYRGNQAAAPRPLAARHALFLRAL